MVGVIVVALVAFQPGPDPPSTPTQDTATQPQPTPGPTVATTEALRRIRIDTWSWDANSITISITNTGDTFVSGTAQCRVEFGASGVIWPQLALRGVQPGESWTETYRDQWRADLVPTQVPECVVVSP